MKPCMPDIVPGHPEHPGSPCMIETECNPELLLRWAEICLTCGRTDRTPVISVAYPGVDGEFEEAASFSARGSALPLGAYYLVQDVEIEG